MPGDCAHLFEMIRRGIRGHTEAESCAVTGEPQLLEDQPELQRHP